MAPSGHLVLITGGTGFVASHCMVLLLKKGYRVRTSVRATPGQEKVREALRNGGISEDDIAKVEFCTLDLLKDDGWNDACAGCTYVLHIASPLPDAKHPPKHEDEFIIPARDGTLRALRAAKAAGSVKRVVVTSSTRAIFQGHPDSRLSKGPFTEEDWTKVQDAAHPMSAYDKGKAIADQAAWEWYRESAEGMEMSCVYPGGIAGPLLSDRLPNMNDLFRQMLTGKLPLLPQLAFGCVDVRDLADLHLRATEMPEASGERFIAVADRYTDFRDMAEILKKRLGVKASKVSTRLAPNLLLKAVGLFDANVASITADLGKRRPESNEKAKRVLGWAPRDIETTIVDSVESLENLGLLEA